MNTGEARSIDTGKRAARTDRIITTVDSLAEVITELQRQDRFSVDGGGAKSQLAKSPTLTLGATQMGVILGTAAYMSPEQAKGVAVDKRADIWAFGCVLYEMLTGRRTFEGQDVTDTLAAVVRAEPEWDALPPLDMGVRPEKVDATAFDTATPIKHVVFLIKENRTFDNMFGMFPGANGATTGIDQGQERPLTQAPDRLPEDIKHCYECSLQAWNEGKMDGFATISEWADRFAYTQYRPEDLPAYWHWAERNVLADNFFASAQGPSFPNHLYTIAAQSGGTHENPIQDLKVLDLVGHFAGLESAAHLDKAVGQRGLAMIDMRR